MEANTKGMNETREEIKNNTNKMEEIKNNMEANTQTMRGEMQNMGAGLQDGLEKLKIGNGERRWATCWGRLVKVTEEATVTRKKLMWNTKCKLFNLAEVEYLSCLYWIICSVKLD